MELKRLLPLTELLLLLAKLLLLLAERLLLSPQLGLPPLEARPLRFRCRDLPDADARLFLAKGSLFGSERGLFRSKGGLLLTKLHLRLENLTHAIERAAVGDDIRLRSALDVEERLAVLKLQDAESNVRNAVREYHVIVHEDACLSGLSGAAVGKKSRSECDRQCQCQSAHTSCTVRPRES